MSPSRPVTAMVVTGCLAGVALVVPRWFDVPGAHPVAPSESPPAQPVTAAAPGLDRTLDRTLDRAEVVPARVIGAAQVLRRWDEQRAAAYASNDEARLGALYEAGSRAGAADRRLLRSYTDRGLTVVGLRVQLVEVEVLRSRDDRLVLRVQDRVAAGVVVAAGERTPLPSDRPTSRVVTLVRMDGQWLVRSVRPDRFS